MPKNSDFFFEKLLHLYLQLLVRDDFHILISNIKISTKKTIHALQCNDFNRIKKNFFQRFNALVYVALSFYTVNIEVI